MGPKPAKPTDDHDLFRTELVNLIDQRHELVRLAELIDWSAFAAEWSPQFVATTGRPALPTRLMASLLYLKHVYAMSGTCSRGTPCNRPEHGLEASHAT